MANRLLQPRWLPRLIGAVFIGAVGAAAVISATVGENHGHDLETVRLGEEEQCGQNSLSNEALAACLAAVDGPVRREYFSVSASQFEVAPDQAALASAIALADPRVVSLASGQFLVIDVVPSEAVAPVKSGEPLNYGCDPGACVQVTVFNYDLNRGAHVIVDVLNSRTLDVTNASFPHVSAIEADIALTVIRRDLGVRERLGSDLSFPAGIFLISTPSGPCSTHRCVLAPTYSPKGYDEVVVDLATASVEYWPPRKPGP